MTEPEKYWFPAKRFGWGWGLPITWQGWVAFVIFFSLLLAGAFLFPPNRDMVAFLVYVGVITAAFCAICYAKGEPPSWHWGEK